MIILHAAVRNRHKEVQQHNLNNTTKWLDMVAHTCNPSTLGGQDGQITRSGDQDHPRQHGETLSLLKIQKSARCGGTCL